MRTANNDDATSKKYSQRTDKSGLVEEYVCNTRQLRTSKLSSVFACVRFGCSVCVLFVCLYRVCVFVTWSVFCWLLLLIHSIFVGLFWGSSGWLRCFSLYCSLSVLFIYNTNLDAIGCIHITLPFASISLAMHLNWKRGSIASARNVRARAGAHAKKLQFCVLSRWI